MAVVGGKDASALAGFEQMAEGLYRLQVPFPGCWTGVMLALGEPAVLVDSGGSAETVDSCILPALDALGVPLAEVGWLALTHIHGDHAGGAARLKALWPRLRIAVLAESAPRMCDPLAYSRHIRARFPAHSPEAPASLCGTPPDRLLSDGDRLGPLTLLHTPGHDTDSCCYLHTPTGTLLTGDSLQLNGTVSQGCALLMDTRRYGATLERLMELPLENIVCGHPYLPLGPQALGKQAVRRYLAACLACHAHDRGFVEGMAAAGITDTAAIARALIRSVGGREPKHLFLPMHTVEGYLAGLQTGPQPAAV